MANLASNTHPENICPECKHPNITFDATFGFYKCNSCQYVWSYSQDDPDYDEQVLCSCCGGKGWIKDEPCAQCGGLGVYVYTL
jgi:DnaJ-class molecular chaperone